MSMLWKLWMRVLCVLFALAVTGAAWAQGFQRVPMAGEVPYAWGLSVGDMDNDGDLDVVATGRYGPLAWLEKRDGTTVPHELYYGVGGLRGVAVGDFDADGDSDIVFACYNENRFVRIENTGAAGNGRFVEHELLDSCRGAYSVRAGDVNGDGRLDVVTTEYLGNRLRIFEQRSGELVLIKALTVPSYPLDAVIADFDGDGDMDIVGSSNDYPMFWAEQGSSDTTWTVHNLDFGTYCTGVAVADLDSNGTADVVGALYSGNQIHWWQHSTTGTFTDHSLTGTMTHARGVGIADFNLDGRPDIVAVAQDGQARWWQNAGNGVFTSHTMQSGDSLYGLVVSDFDRDGDPDVVVTDLWSSAVCLYRNTMGIPAVAAGSVHSLQGTPVVGARVQLLGIGTMAVTDPAGSFLLASLPGTYDVQVRCPCWNDTLMSNVTIAQAETTHVQVAMTRPLFATGVSSVNLTVQNGGTAEAPLPLSNSGDGPLTVRAMVSQATDSAWLSVSPAVLTVPPGESAAFTVQVHPDTANSYNWDFYGMIELHHNACPDSVVRIGVLAYVFAQDAPDHPAGVPLRTALLPAYPNPFNAVTVTAFDLAVPSDVTLSLFDITGRSVRTLSAGWMSAGHHRLPLSAGDLPSGVYMLSLRAGGERYAQKLLLIK